MMLHADRYRWLAVMALALWARADGSLRLTTEHLPPYNIVSSDLKQVSGVVADKVFEMMRRAGVRYTVQPSGWNRAYTLARTQPDTCVFSTTRMPEREALFKWVGPLAVNEWQIYGRINEPSNAHSLAEIGGDTISVYHNDALDIFLKAHGYHVLESQSNEDSLRALLVQRAAYWATGDLSSTSPIQAAAAVGKVRLLFNIERHEVFLACNRAVDDDLIAKLREAQRSMEQDGTAARIEQRYFLR